MGLNTVEYVDGYTRQELIAVRNNMPVHYRGHLDTCALILRDCSVPHKHWIALDIY